MLLRLVLSFVALFLSMTVLAATPPEIKVLQQLMEYLKPAIMENKENCWRGWAEKNSAVSEQDDFDWDSYLDNAWRHHWLKVSDHKLFCAALGLFKRKEKTERWNQAEMPRESIDVKELERLLSDVGVREAIDAEGEYDWGVIPGGTLFRMENRFCCMNKYVIQDHRVKIRKEICGIASNRVLDDADKADNQSVFFPKLAGDHYCYGLFDRINKLLDIGDPAHCTEYFELLGLVFITVAKLHGISAIGPIQLFDFFVDNSLFGKASPTTVYLKNQAVNQMDDWEDVSKYKPEKDLSWQPFRFNFLLSHGSLGKRATTVDNVKSLCLNAPGILGVGESVILFLSQPHAPYQLAIYQNFFANKAATFLEKAKTLSVQQAEPYRNVSETLLAMSKRAVEVTALSLPIDKARYTLADQLHALQQWAQLTLTD